MHTKRFSFDVLYAPICSGDAPFVHSFQTLFYNFRPLRNSDLVDLSMRFVLSKDNLM
jgi:hypothetical protein